MSNPQYRLRLDPSLIEAADAAARAKGVTLGTFVEQAIRLMIDPVNVIETASKRLSEQQSDMIEMRDRINGISEFIVDLYENMNAQHSQD